MHTRTWNDVSFRYTFVVRHVTRLPVIATHVHTLKIRHPAAKAETRKRILRTMLEEVVVRAEPGHLRLKLHWKGGDHTIRDVQKSCHGEHRWKRARRSNNLSTSWLVYCLMEASQQS
jgi:hypothetical protein